MALNNTFKSFSYTDLILPQMTSHINTSERPISWKSLKFAQNDKDWTPNWKVGGPDRQVASLKDESEQENFGSG